MKKQLMKNKNPFFFLLFCSLFFYLSCNNNIPADNPQYFGSFDKVEKEWLLDTTQVTPLSIPTQREESFLLSQYVDTSWSVPLATTENGIIGKIDKVLVHKEVIYVLDVQKAKCLLTFDLKGNFLSKIGSTGTGLGRFQQPDDFCINEEEEKIVIYDDLHRKLFYFNFDGQFLEEKTVNYFLFGIENLSDGQGYVLNSFGRSNIKTKDIPHRLLKAEASGQIQKKGLAYSKIEEQLGIRINPIEFSSFENEILYSPGFLGDIYAVNAEGIQLKFRIDLGDRVLPPDFESMEMMKFMEKFNSTSEKNYAYFSGPFFETKHHLIFNIVEGGKYYTSIYSKETNTLKYGLPVHDLSHSIETTLFLTTYQDEYLVAWGDSYYLATEKEKYGKSKSKEVVEMLDRLTPLDNPVLTFYKMKEPYRTLTGL